MPGQPPFLFTTVPFTEAYETMIQFIYFIWIFLNVCGLVANTINIIVFTRMGLKDNVTITLFTLSVSDLLYMVFQTAITAGLIIQQVNPDYPWPFNPHIITLWPFTFSLTFYNYSSFVAAFLGLVRCMCVVKPLKFKSMFTVSRTIKILLLLLVVSVALRSPTFTNWIFVWSVNPQTNTSFLSYTLADHTWKTRMYDDYVNTNLVTWAIYFTISICAALIAYKLREALAFRNSLKQAPAKETTTEIADVETSIGQETGEFQHNQKSKKSAPTKISNKEVQVIKAVILVCVIYIVTNLPALMLSLAQLIEPEIDFSGRLINLYRIAADAKSTGMLVNASVNILIYLGYNTKFKQESLHIFSILKKMLGN